MDETATTLDHPGSDTNETATRSSDGFVTRDRLTAVEADIQDQLRRLQADFANFRRRTHSIAEQSADNRSVEIITLLLPVIDNLERALATHTSDRAYAQGVELTYRHFMNVLASLGLQVIPSIGETFDPQVHEAVTTVRDDDAADGTVVEEFRKGYRLNGTLLRPAQVSVTMTSIQSLER